MDKAVYDFVLIFVSIIWEAFPFVVLSAVPRGTFPRSLRAQRGMKAQRAFT